MIEVKGKLRLGDDGKLRFIHESGRASRLASTPELRAELEAHTASLIGKETEENEPSGRPSVSMCRDCKSPIQGVSHRWSVGGDSVLLCHDCHLVRVDRGRRLGGAPDRRWAKQEPSNSPLDKKSEERQKSAQKCPICARGMFDDEQLGAVIAGKYIPLCPTCFSAWQDQVKGYVNMPVPSGKRPLPPVKCRICDAIVPKGQQHWPAIAGKFTVLCSGCFGRWEEQTKHLSAPSSTTVVTWKEVEPPKEGVTVTVKKAGEPKKAKKKAPTKKAKKSAKKGR